jgi:hypothetical protein
MYIAESRRPFPRGGSGAARAEGQGAGHGRHAVRYQPLHWAREATTTLGIYAHLFADDHSDAMAALGAMGSLAASGNVVSLWRRSRS